MTYQLSDLVTTVRKRAKDNTFDGDLITDFIQATQNEVLGRSRFKFMEIADTDTATKGSTEYQLAEDVDVILSLKLFDSTNAEWRPEYLSYPRFFENYDPDSATATTPTFYSVFGDTVLWSAPLDKDYTLKIKYLKTPAVLALDADVPDVPERFKELLVRGALARVEEYRDNYDIAALHQRKVEDLTEDMLNRTALRQLATLPRAKFGVR